MARLKSGESLIRDEQVFDPGSVPDTFLFRESQLTELAACLKPAVRGGKATHAFLFGKPATGKTTATRIAFSELEKAGNKSLTVHINCHIYNSAYRIMAEIHRKLYGFVPPETGLPLTTLYDKVFSKLTKEKKSLIVALDDLNFQERTLANSVLYDLIRSYEAYPETKTAIWCIAMRNELHKLDDKVRSAFVAHAIEFVPYRSEEIQAILRTRADAGLAPGAISDALLGRIALGAHDLRHGIETLRNAALLADGTRSRAITEAHVTGALAQFETPASSSIIDDEKIILDLLRKKESRESGELFAEFKNITGASYATFYRLLQKLKLRNLVTIQHVGKAKGRTSMIKLKK